MAKIRIVNADFYFASPINGLDALTSEFRGTQITKVPIIRTFGATDAGYKTCLHVHGVFPYIYIPHDGKEHHESLRYKLANAIDKTVNVALGQAASKAQHVYKISLVSGIPYYGYHSREHQFFKIFFYNPHLMKKVCTFLENGTILGRIYQPHEAHIPYIQQFMIDYNLHGMSFIQLSEVHHRHQNGVSPVFTSPGNYVLPANITRISRCAWECDTRAECILNVQDVVPNAMTNPGIAAIWADERQRRIDLSQSSQVSHILTQNRKDLEPTQSHIVYQHKLEEQLLSASSTVETQQDDANVSVYPAETPESGDLLSRGSENFDVSHVEETIDNDEDCQNLFAVLCDLAEANDIAQKTSIPEDSILSQLPLVDDNAINLDGDEENELDLSIPLENTPVKPQPVMNNDSDDEFDNLSDSYFINIPQIDGSYDLRSSSKKTTSNTSKCTTESTIMKNDGKDDLKMVIKNVRKEKVKKKTIKTVSDSLQMKKIVKKVIQSTVTTSQQGEETKSTKEVTRKRTTKKECEKSMDGNINNTSNTDSKQIVPSPKKSPNSKSPYQTSIHEDKSFKYPPDISKINSRNTRSTIPAVDTSLGNVHNIDKIPSTQPKNLKVLSSAKRPRIIKLKPTDEASNYSIEALDKQSLNSPKITHTVNITNVLDNLKSSKQQIPSDSKECYENSKLLCEVLEDLCETTKESLKTRNTSLANGNLSRSDATNAEKVKYIPVSLDKNKIGQSLLKEFEKKIREPRTKKLANANNGQIRKSDRLKKKIVEEEINTILPTENTSMIVDNIDSLKLNEIEICEPISKDTSICVKKTNGRLLPSSKNLKSIKRSTKLTLLEKTEFASNIAEIAEPIFDDICLSKKPQKLASFLNPSKDHIENSCLPSIETSTKTPALNTSFPTKSKLTEAAVKDNNICGKPVKDLPALLLAHSSNEGYKSKNKIVVKSQSTVRKRKLNGLKEGYGTLKSKPLMKEDNSNTYSTDMFKLFYNYLCKDDNIDDGRRKPRSRKVKDTIKTYKEDSDTEYQNSRIPYNYLCGNQGLGKEKFNKPPVNECTNYRIPKIKYNAKYYKEVPINECLNGRIPCNHTKRQCLENAGVTKNTISLKWNSLPVLSCDSSLIYSSRINNNFSEQDSCKSPLKENLSLNGINVTTKLRNSKKKPIKTSKLRVNKNQVCPRVPRKQKLSVKTLEYRKKLRSKRLAQEVQKDMVKYIALQTGKKPKFNLVFGRRFPVLPINISKTNCNQFPNTEWSNELVDVYRTPSISNNNIVVLEDKLLADHEKYDLSSLFLQTSPPNEIYDCIIDASNNNYVSTNFNSTDFDSILYPLDILDYNETLPDINMFTNDDYESESLLDVDQMLEDICQSQSIINCTEVMKNALDTNNTSEANNNNIVIEVCDYKAETSIAKDDEYGMETKAADVQFLLDKNNYRSQLTMEKFRYMKRNQDRAFENLNEYFSKYVENSNISGRLVMQEAEREILEATNNISDEDDDVESNQFFLLKTVRFRKRVNVREYVPTAPISEHSYNDTIYRLGSSDQLSWAHLNRSRTYDHLLSVDGPNDSSDDEDDYKIPKKRARITRKHPSYKSLPLVCGKLSQVTHTGAREIPFSPETAKSDNEVGTSRQSTGSTTIRYSPKPPTCNNNLNISTVCDNTVFSTAKRKLTFQEIDTCALDKTIIEESISCKYKSKSSTPNANIITKLKHCDNKSVLGKSNKEDCNSSDDLFSDEEVDASRKYLTKSERYDLEANYIPKAGTSALKSSGEVAESNAPLETINKISDSNHFGSPTGDFVLVQNKYDQELDLDKTITQSSSIEDCSNLSLGDITTFRRKQELDNTLSAPQSLTQNLTIYESSPKVNYKETVDGFCELVPKYKPPTQEYIQSTMIEYNIPSVRTQVPFYGNSMDVTGPVEVGMQSLYIRGGSAEFISDFHEGIDAIGEAASNFAKTLNPDCKFTSREIINLKSSFFGNETTVIETVCKPPSKAVVKLWCKENTKQKVDEIKSSEVSVSSSFQSSDDVTKHTNSTDISINQINNIDEDVLRNVHSIDEINNTEIVIDLENKPNCLKIKASTKNQKDKNLLQTIHRRSLDNSCQITGASLNNTHGFQMPLENLQDARAVHEHQHLTVIVMELHIQTRGDLKPNPELDALCAIFYAIFNDVPDDGDTPCQLNGLFAVNIPPSSKSQSAGLHLNGAGVPSCNVTYFDDEPSLINGFVAFLHENDPDILVGYEIQMLSWGYLIERGAILGINLYPLLSRIEEPTPRSREKHEDAFGDLYITGRIVLDLWRILKHEIALQSYTFENIVYHILHQRVSLHSFRDLTNWWNHRYPNHRHRTVEYYLYRVKTTLKLIDQLDLIGRTSEMARLFGILFYEVLSRGSQFRVESMMLRLAKPLKYIPVSPSVQQRAKMRAPEFLPLILEPESKLYTDPVIVLDFQSLYPSIIIAYNYCFSTCIGRVEHLGNNSAFEFAATQLKISRRKVRKLLNAGQLNFSPCGVAFVKAEVRQGILPTMLQEILDTRLMVKKSMKMHKNNKTLQRVLHSRQLGLKLIANVTYGYTAANFSGRMPAVEVGDSVVGKGRETLRRAIKLVESHPTWNCRVVYGDTDSMFVLVHGRDRAEAFRIGAEIAEAVTAANPSPIRLKLEKVYQPCILQTKKRYVGYMYETPDQNAPVYEAKGIETVRRDGCPAVTKMLEKCLRILFESRDVSQIKNYVLRQFSKIISARASIQDLTFAKEYRGASGYRPSACVPALELTRKWIAIDKRSEPRSGERVPYVIVNGPPGLPLIRMVRSPRELLLDDSLKPNALYYITRVIIPPINRCFKLIGADLHQWYNEMPRKQYKYLPTSSPNKGKKSTISQYFTTIHCATCDQQTKDGVCASCYMQPQRTSFILHEKIRTLEISYQNTLKICESCTRRKTDIQCISLDCPVLYRHIRNDRDLQQSNFIRELVYNLPSLEDF